MPRHRKTVTLPRPYLNITSMMDLVLNLITFFILVANFAAASLPPMRAPEPDRSLARALVGANLVVVNVLANSGDETVADVLQVGVERIRTDDYQTLIAKLRKEVSISKDVEISIRADKTLRYDQIQPVMMAIAEAGVTRIHMAAMEGN